VINPSLHLIDVGCRERVLRGGSDRKKPGFRIFPWSVHPCFAKGPPDPFDYRKPLSACALSDIIHLLVGKQHLQSLTHRISLLPERPRK
jgi:hypothetical protein